MSSILRVTASVNLDEGAINQMLRSPDGPVGRFGQGKANNMTKAAKRFAPYKTGELRNSISTKTIRSGDDLAWEISATARHAIYIIEGKNGNRRPNDFLTRAAEAVFGI